MLSIYLQGFALGVSLILPLGPQNAFVMNQGVKRHYHLMTAAICALSDIVLIFGGIFGGSALLHRSKLLLMLITWAGVLFLLWYGFCALRTALRHDVSLSDGMESKQGRVRIIASILAVTWLNPHVYIDTFVVLGSLGSQLPTMAARQWFAAGTMSASVIWFFGLAILASWLSPRLRTARAQRIINLLVGAVMWLIAGQLAWSALHNIW